MAQAHAPRGSCCCICGLDLSETHVMAPGMTSDMPAKTEGSSSDEKLKGKVAEDAARAPTEAHGVYVFACGHTCHSTCLEHSPQWCTSFRYCPVCSSQKSTKETPTIPGPPVRNQPVQLRNNSTSEWSLPTGTQSTFRSRVGDHHCLNELCSPALLSQMSTEL